jgi:pyruvate dehydrogenase E2 component (dihydrolipoamide acetyltransferase)
MTSTEYTLPQMPFGGPEITIVRWLKRADERVSAGEPLLVVVNDRVELALPAPSDGVLERTLASAGAEIAAGAPVATIAALPVTSTAELPHTLQPDTPVDQSATGEWAAPEAPQRITPVARQIASFAEIDITKLSGSGISGRIVKADLLAILVKDAPRIEAKQHLVSRSPSLQPPASSLSGDHIYVLTAVEVDMQRVVETVARLQPGYARLRLELSHCACVALAAVAALACHPLLNSAWHGEVIIARRCVHLAVAPDGGTPTCLIPDAQDLNLRGLARALGSRLTDTTSGDRASTFTIAELGDQAWGDPSALARGRSAALGVGAVRPRPLVLDDGGIERLAMRHTTLLTLAYDPRVLDQSHADAFLRDLKRRLEQFPA